MSILRMTAERAQAHQKRVKGGVSSVAKKPAKYRNVKVAEDGIVHDSKKEARRYRDLRLLLRTGEIDVLARQVAFALPGQTEYRADFVHGKVIDGTLAMTVEDVKSDATRRLQAYRIKVRQMRAIHGIEVIEV